MVIKNLSNYWDIERTCIAIKNLRTLVSDYLAERKQREVGDEHARGLRVDCISVVALTCFNFYVPCYQGYQMFTSGVRNICIRCSENTPGMQKLEKCSGRIL